MNYSTTSSQIIQSLIDDQSSDSDTDRMFIQENDDNFSSSSSSESSTGCKPRRTHHRIEKYMNTIERYDDEEFKEHFRMQRSTCSYVIDQIEKAQVIPEHMFGRKKITTKKAFYITLWYLANMETFRQVADRFNVTKSSVHRLVSKIVDYLVKSSPQYIMWPDGQRKQIIKNEFYKKQGIYGIVGAIDGTHIKIKRPVSKYAYVYYNRKGDYSILLQGVCDHQKRFLDIFCGEAGSMHDARMLKKSSLYEKGVNGFFQDDFLLGDSAYPCVDWLVTPFKDNGMLTQHQKTFNYKHSASRIVVEHAFGLLKSRFRRLRMFDNNNIMFIVKCVVAATVLHNMCITFDDLIEYEEDNGDDEFDPQFVESVSGIIPRESKRDAIFRTMFS